MEVNSFDVFDTLLARKVLQPTDIFNIIETKFPYKNFKQLRMKAEQNSGRTFDDIYTSFQRIANETDEMISLLKKFEIQTESENSYLIKTNVNRVNDGDILISDMYLSSEQIMYLLNSIGFTKNVTLYSSSCGMSKHDGSMYNFLKNKYNIKLHLGDNHHADVNMSRKYHISSELTTVHQPTPTELFFINNNYKEFGFLLRQFRHQNPYPINTVEYNCYYEQTSYNIPLLLLISQQLQMILLEENRNTLLCSTRDGCLLEIIFSQLFDQFNCLRFHCSRHMYYNYNQEYKDYLKNIYDDKNCIIFDGQGSFYSGRKCFIETFGFLPRVHMFCYDKLHEKYDKFTYSICNKFGGQFETLNVDIIGSLIGIKNGNFLRKEIEYDVSYAKIYKNTVETFCEFIKPYKHLFPKEDVLVDFLSKIDIQNTTIEYTNNFKNNYIDNVQIGKDSSHKRILHRTGLRRLPR